MQPSSSVKRILILGAGFAGLTTALELGRKKLPAAYEIVLVDQFNVHVYTPDLYEIATAFNKKITEQCLTMLKDTVATPFSSILGGSGVRFVRDFVMGIDAKKKTVLFKNRLPLKYDYLVIALGSVVNFYDIPGLERFSYPFKTFTHALSINCHVDSYFLRLFKNKSKRSVNIVVGGGGATGVELACELPGYIKLLCEKYGFPKRKVTFTLVECSPQLCMAGEKGTMLLKARLKKLGVEVITETCIKKVDSQHLYVESKKKSQKVSYNILLWAGGVMPNPLLKKCFKKTAPNGALVVNSHLQYEDDPNVFVGGDSAFFVDSKTKERAPLLAQVAVEEAKVIAENLAATINKKPLRNFSLYIKGVVIPLGGKYAFFKKGNKMFMGMGMWILRRLIDLRYALRVLPPIKAVKKWIHDTYVFVEND